MNTLGIDVETFSPEPLKKTGVYKYAESKDFYIQLFSYSVDRGPVVTVDIEQGEELSADILAAIQNPNIKKTAWNAAFERQAIREHFGVSVGTAGWECTMSKAAMIGLPLSLEDAAKVLRLPLLKDAAGTELIKYFSMPCKPTKTNGQRTQNRPVHSPEKWEQYKRYNARDVEVEQLISEKLDAYPVSDFERRVWRLDQLINDRGVCTDPVFVRNAINFIRIRREQLIEEAIDVTNLQNPNSRNQLVKWLNSEMPLYEITSLRKTDLPKIRELAEGLIGEKAIKRIIDIRQELSKTGVKKYSVINSYACLDNCARGMLQYYGAGRTGRFAGRGPQPHNLKKNDPDKLPDIEEARALVREGDVDTFGLIYPFTDTLGQLIRTSFVPRPGNILRVADFKSIEARILAWLAGEQWKLEIFKTHGKIYEATAARMFNMEIAHVTKGSVHRNKGKMAELALGYQGSGQAITNIEVSNEVPERNRIPEQELPGIVEAWRTANPMIVRLWRDVNSAAIRAVRSPGILISLTTGGDVLLKFVVRKNILHIMLPSGRALCYIRPRIRKSKFDRDAVAYEGMDKTWRLIDTYGGKLVENITQAIARDCLAEALIKLHSHSYFIVLHVHDEVVADQSDGSVAEMCEIMSEPIPWAPGLPLGADGYDTMIYKKD